MRCCCCCCCDPAQFRPTSPCSSGVTCPTVAGGVVRRRKKWGRSWGELGRFIPAVHTPFLPHANTHTQTHKPAFLLCLCTGVGCCAAALPWRRAVSAASLPGIGFVRPPWLARLRQPLGPATLKRQFDGVLLRILPSLNRSCCHLYFDLCSPWSIYAYERWGGEERRKKGRRRWKKEDSDSYNARYYTRGSPCGTFAF